MVSSNGLRVGDVEEVGDLIVSRQKPLGLPGRFKTLHDPFASPCRLMRILRPIVEPFVLAMFDAKAHLGPRRAIGAELVGDHNAGRPDSGFQEFAHKPLRRVGVSAPLNQDVEDESVLVDSAPQPMRLAGDRDNDFIHVPFIATSGCTPTDPLGECLSELHPPLAHRLVGYANPASCQHLLDHAKAQRKSEIQPNGVADHLGRKAMATIERVTGDRHGTHF